MSKKSDLTPDLRQFTVAESNFSKEQAAQWLTVSLPTIKRLIKTGKLATWKVGGRVLISGTELLRFRDAQHGAR
jgi:excisionase family DNA binding protein